MKSRSSRMVPHTVVNAALKRMAKTTANLLASQGIFANDTPPFTRDQIGRGLGMDPVGRDLDAECGYETGEPSIDIYRKYYDREGIATRVVSVFPDECWSVYPELYEKEDPSVTTQFERRWKKLMDRLNPWHYLHRVDELSGVGRFGILLMGINDGQTMERAVRGVTEEGTRDLRKSALPVDSNRLMYLRPFSEDLVTVSEVEERTNSPRCGQPTIYEVQMLDPASGGMTTDRPGRVVSKLIHWTRVIHVADNRGTSEIYGTPRMRPVLNRLRDLRKILGGSGEMFWRGAFPGYSFEAFPETEDSGSAGDFDEESIKDQIEAYANGFRRYLALTGMTVKPLLPQIGDPTNHVTQQIMAICIALGVPFRIFTGSEAGHLASTQDSGTWNRRLARRQQTYLEPMLVRPFIDRLQLVGVLPEVEDYFLSWRDLNTMTDEVKATVALKKSQALMQYVTGGCETVLPLREYLTLILGLTPAEASMVVAANAANAAKRTTEVWKKPVVAKPQGGGRVGKPPRSSPGRVARRSS